MTYKPKMTHEERRARRAEIAKALAEGASITDVMVRFAVSHVTAYEVAKAFRVPVSRLRARGGDTTIRTIALALQGTRSKEIAAVLGVTKQSVSGILLRATDAGIRFPPGVVRGRNAT